MNLEVVGPFSARPLCPPTEATLRESSPALRVDRALWRTEDGTPSSAAAFRVDRAPTLLRSSSPSQRGHLPSRCPCALALTSPLRTRSATLARSNSAMAARMCIWSFPAGVVASIPSARDTKSTPRAYRSSSTVTRWRRFWPRRSRRPHEHDVDCPAPGLGHHPGRAVQELAEHSGLGTTQRTCTSARRHSGCGHPAARTAGQQ